MRDVLLKICVYSTLCVEIMGCAAQANEKNSLSNIKKESVASQKIQAISKDVQFDIDALKSLGYGAEVADFFKQNSQLLPGQYEVNLVVNGSVRYTTTVMIGQSGQLCTDSQLQQILKLKKLPLLTECTQLEDLYPNTQVTIYPNEFKIDILIAENAFDPVLRGDVFTYGGMALMSNYRLYGMQMSGWEKQTFYQGQFESGINWQNWVLRNNSSFSTGKSNTQYQFNETTLAHSVPSLTSQFQVGQISSQGSLFAGTPLNGAQLYSDSSLTGSNRLVVPITGVAETPATIEVNQNGRLLYRTLVPAGAFELDKINNVVSGQPLLVTVIQDNGQRQQFTVTTARKQSGEISLPSYQFALGSYRKRHGEDDIQTPLIGSLEGSFSVSITEYTGGVLISDLYQSSGLRVSHEWEELLPISSSLGFIGARNQDKEGAQVDVNMNTAIESLSFGLSSLYRSQNYPTLDETVQKKQLKSTYDDFNWEYYDTQSSNTVSISGSYQDWGHLGYSLSYNHYYGNRSDDVFHTLNYGKKLAGISLNASFQAGNHRDNRLFFNASMPLGQKTLLSTQLQRYQGETSTTITASHRPNTLRSYSVGGSRSNNQDRLNGSVNTITPYSQFAASGTWSDNQTHSFMMSATGAVVYSPGIFATSPIPLGDTFGILRIPGQSGVQVSTLGGGNTLTNHFGTAAIPTLPAHKKTTVQLDTQHLPLNVRLDTTSFDVAVARGTVLTREVGATIMKQLLLSIVMPDGKPAPSGASVLDETGGLIGVIMGEGYVMLSNEQIGKSVMLRIPNQTDCIVKYTVPEHFDINALYEEVNASCERE